MASKTAAPPMVENDLLNLVIDYAQRMGWLVAHFRPAMLKDGTWRTAVSADGKGFPDLVLVRERVVVWVELKKEGGKLSPEQIVWRDALQAAGQEWYVWQPSDWSEIERVLGPKEVSK